jgi:hypothetical protein
MTRALLILVAPLLIALLVGSLSIATGCSTTSRRAAGPDVMGGLEFQVQETRPGRSYALYRVQRDGTIEFGGGLDARNGKCTWSGSLTEDERERLLSLLDQYGWPTIGPSSTGLPEGVEYEIQMQWPGQRRTYHVAGETDAVTEIVRVLQAASSRRNQEFLQSLPKAGRQE